MAADSTDNKGILQITARMDSSSRQYGLSETVTWIASVKTIIATRYLRVTAFTKATNGGGVLTKPERSAA